MQSVPLLMCIALALYMDRVVRQEVIFDSSALTCTVFVAHVINICRSSILHVDDRHSLAYIEGQQQQQVRQMSLLSSVPISSSYSGPTGDVIHGNGSFHHGAAVISNSSLASLYKSYQKQGSDNEMGGWWELPLLYILYTGWYVICYSPGVEVDEPCMPWHMYW